MQHLLEKLPIKITGWFFSGRQAKTCSAAHGTVKFCLFPLPSQHRNNCRFGLDDTKLPRVRYLRRKHAIWGCIVNGNIGDFAKVRGCQTVWTDRSSRPRIYAMEETNPPTSSWENISAASCSSGRILKGKEAKSGLSRDYVGKSSKNLAKNIWKSLELQRKILTILRCWLLRMEKVT